MNKIYNDLGVVEILIYNLDLWLSKWNIEIFQVYIDVLECNMIIEKVEYFIVYVRIKKEKYFFGILIVLNKLLEFFNVERKFDVFFIIKEIMEVSVYIFWEVIILQLRIGYIGCLVYLILVCLVYIF